MNFRLWIEQYFTVYRALELKPSTLSSYLKNLVYIPFDWEYETVTLFDVQSLINKLVANGLSSSTVKHVVQVIREPLDNGFRFGLPDRHGTLYALSLPKMRKKLVHALSDAELTKLKPYLNESEYSDVYLALLHTGMRCCELTGLNCGDFDFQSSSLKIHRSFYRGKLSEATKSDSGIRVIPLNLPSKLIFIRNMCVFTPNKPLFRNLSGSRLSYNTLVHNWHKILDLADVERCGLHVLRHTYATKLLESGVSLKVVSALLGHKSIAVTADIYCDVTMAAKREAVDKFAEFDGSQSMLCEERAKA